MQGQTKQQARLQTVQQPDKRCGQTQQHTQRCDTGHSTTQSTGQRSKSTEHTTGSETTDLTTTRIRRWTQENSQLPNRRRHRTTQLNAINNK